MVIDFIDIERIIEDRRLDPYYYSSSFVNFYEKVVNSEYVNLGSLLKTITNGFDFREYAETGTPYIKVANVKQGEFDFSKILTFKKEIDRNYNYWSDLELALGDYIKNIKTLKEFDTLFEDIRNDLGKYIEIEEEIFDFNDIPKKIDNDLIFPENYLSAAEKLIIETFKSSFGKSTACNVNIISYNYLNTSNIICLFGLSIGDTDKCWWQKIGELILQNNRKLIIFSIGDEIPPIHAYKKERVKTEIINSFLLKAEIKPEQNIDDKIFAGINTDIFKVKLKTKSIII
jgi:hypothetical protein